MGGAISNPLSANVVLDINEKYQAPQRKPRNWGPFVNNLFTTVQEDDVKQLVVRLNRKYLGVDGANEFFNFTQTNNTLTAVDLCGNSFAVGALQHIARSLYANDSIVELLMADNQLGNHLSALHEPLLHNSTLQWLSLAHNSITKKGAGVIANIIHFNNSLTRVDLSHNDLGAGGAHELASALGHTFTVSQLILTHCQLGDKGLRFIADGMTRNKSLTLLDVAQNGITSAGTKYFALVMENVTCQLEHLDLAHNSVSDSGARELSEHILHFKNVRSLILRHNDLGDNGAKFISSAVTQPQSEEVNLTHLDLSVNNVTEAECLAHIIKRNSKIKQLNVSFNPLGKKGGKLLSDALKENNTLTDLHCAKTRMGEDFMNLLAHMTAQTKKLVGCEHVDEEAPMYANPPHEEVLPFEQPRLHSGFMNMDVITPGTVEAFIRKITDNDKHLHRCNMKCHRLTPAYAMKIGRALANNTHLTSLNLHCNCFGVDGITYLCGGLKVNNTLTHLDISQNFMGVEGAQTFAEMLEGGGLKALKDLVIADNDIRSEGCRPILEALKTNETITSLNVEWNNLKHVAGTHLGNFLSKNTSIRKLHVSGNVLGDVGVATTLDGMVENEATALSEFSFAVNDLHEATGNKVLEIVQQCPTLTKIDLGRNFIPETTLEKIQPILNANATHVTKSNALTSNALSEGTNSNSEGSGSKGQSRSSTANASGPGPSWSSDGSKKGKVQ
eukprot:TRINITY_DN66754_c9_g3_i1.p1 TRINITY_DN66754_c9_g3~~TRINITY_DN66754_c9_g3_i1.p1  ORF type:complete len:728 (-),score=31.47 TRINITY_DN66754_c9_g3_i1:1451-3634(-)